MIYLILKKIKTKLNISLYDFILKKYAKALCSFYITEENLREKEKEMKDRQIFITIHLFNRNPILISIII